MMELCGYLQIYIYIYTHVYALEIVLYIYTGYIHCTPFRLNFQPL